MAIDHSFKAIEGFESVCASIKTQWCALGMLRGARWAEQRIAAIEQVQISEGFKASEIDRFNTKRREALRALYGKVAQYDRRALEIAQSGSLGSGLAHEILWQSRENWLSIDTESSAAGSIVQIPSSERSGS